jgi:hypothetical protein
MLAAVMTPHFPAVHALVGLADGIQVRWRHAEGETPTEKADIQLR